MGAEEQGRLGATVATALAGLVGALTLGQLGLPLAEISGLGQDVVVGALGSFGSTLPAIVGQLRGMRLTSEPTTVNHHLQRAFRAASCSALFDIGGPVAFPKDWRQLSDLPGATQFRHELLGPEPAGRLHAMLVGLERAIRHDEVVPLQPPADQPAALATTYVDYTDARMLVATDDDTRHLTLALLGGIFVDETIAPWLEANFAATIGEYPAEYKELLAHLQTHLLQRTLVHFDKLLKEEAYSEAWRAFNRRLLETLRERLDLLVRGQGETHAELRALRITVADLQTLQTTTAALLARTDDSIAVLARDLARLLAHYTEHDRRLMEGFRAVFGRLTTIDERLGRIEAVVGATLSGGAGPALADALARLDGLLQPELPPPGEVAAVSRLPHEANPHFVGRQAELRALAAALHAPRASAVICGIGGLGKTQLAVEFGRRYGPLFAGGVFWLDAAGHDRLIEELASCGGPQHLKLWEGKGDLTLEERREHVMGAWQQELPRLLIFDNCEDQNLLAQHRPKLGGCRVLVTSRDQTWSADDLAHKVELAVLDPSESVALLRSARPDLRADDPRLHTIAGLLGQLPLALTLAGSYLATFKHTPGGQPGAYLDELHQVLSKHESLTEEGRLGRPLPTKGHANVETSFLVSYSQLDGDEARPENAPARQALAIGAALAPGAPMPRTLLQAALAARGHHWRLVEKALHRLQRLGLLSGGETRLQLHRLLADLVRQADSLDAAAREELEHILAAEVERLSAADDLATLRLLHPHVRHAVEGAGERDDEAAVRLLNALAFTRDAGGDAVGGLGDLERARAALEKGGALTSILGAEVLNNLAEWYRLSTDNIAEARRLHEQALQLRVELLGPDHPAVAESSNNLGELCRDEGELDGARALFERALTIWSGHGLPGRAAIARNSLAILLLKQGAFAEAAEQFALLAEELEGAAERDERGLGIVRLNLAVSLHRAGRHAEADGMFEQGLTLLRAKLGDTAFETLHFSLRQAEFWFDSGEQERALVAARAVLHKAEEAHGPEYPLVERARGAITTMEEAMSKGAG